MAWHWTAAGGRQRKKGGGPPSPVGPPGPRAAEAEVPELWGAAAGPGGRGRGAGGFSPPKLLLAALASVTVLTLGVRGGWAGGRLLQRKSGGDRVLVTGGAGYIGSHAVKRLLEDGKRVTIVDNLSRGNLGAVDVLQGLAANGQLSFERVDLGDKAEVCRVFREQPDIDLVMHFAAVAYVGESVADPTRYYHNITSNTLGLVECMLEHGVKRLIYSSTCATYGNPEKLPITEATPTVPINPYGQAKLMSENIIRDVAKSNPELQVGILRYFNVYGSDEAGVLGEFPRPELRAMGRITGACFDAALGAVPELKILGTNHPTKDGTCVRDFIHVVDLIDAHVLLQDHLGNPPPLYNVGTGKGVSVREIVEACKKVTGRPIKVVEQAEARPGDYAAVFADNAKIRTELGWTPKYTDVEQGLAHAWAWRSKNPNGYGAPRFTGP